MNCSHKCHEVGLNPWITVCPICGCVNSEYDPQAELPEWLKEFARAAQQTREGSEPGE